MSDEKSDTLEFLTFDELRTEVEHTIRMIRNSFDPLHVAVNAANDEHKVLRARVAELEAFTPTAESINTLPEGIRKYVRDLETRCDPSGDVAARVLAEDNVRGLASRIVELEAKNAEQATYIDQMEMVAVQSIVYLEDHGAIEEVLGDG